MGPPRLPRRGSIRDAAPFRALTRRRACAQIVGRLATQLATILTGKHKPIYRPDEDCGDFVVVLNAKELKFTGNKYRSKLYRWHTTYPGGLKESSPRYLHHVGRPEEVLRRAVWGMLPKNRMRRQRARKLRIFPDEEHPFQKELDGAVPLDFPASCYLNDPVPRFNPMQFREHDPSDLSDWGEPLAEMGDLPDDQKPLME